MKTKELLIALTNKISVLNNKIDSDNSQINILKDQLAEAREQINSLLDRFMAQDFIQYKQNSLSDSFIPPIGIDDDTVNPFKDENLAGTVVKDKDNG